MMNRPESKAGAASDASQASHSRTGAPREYISLTAALSAWKPNRLPTGIAAMIRKRPVRGLVRKVIPAAIGMLPRTGTQNKAAPMIWTPGIRKKTPTNSPIATPRGTDRRVKRQNSEWSTRGPNGLIQRLSASCSRLGMLAAMVRANQLFAGSAMVPHQPALLALPVLLLLIVALVVELAPLGQRDLDLGPAAAVEIDAERHQRHALAGDGAVKLGDLPVVEQQFARPFRLVIVAVAMAELGDVGVDQPDLLVLHLG